MKITKREACLKAVSRLEDDLAKHDRATVAVIIRINEGRSAVLCATSKPPAWAHAAIGALTQVASDVYMYRHGPEQKGEDVISEQSDAFEGGEITQMGTIEDKAVPDEQ